MRSLEQAACLLARMAAITQPRQFLVQYPEKFAIQQKWQA
jgi:hypothetical protein